MEQEFTELSPIHASKFLSPVLLAQEVAGSITFTVMTNIFTIRNSSCGKVIFCQVSHSVHRGNVHGKRGHAWRRGVCLVGGACVAGETATAADGMHPTWNAFFLSLNSVEIFRENSNVCLSKCLITRRKIEYLDVV